jgi:hypothetical protein
MSALTQHCKGRAELLLADAEKTGAQYSDSGTGYAAQAGSLRAMVRLLCDELDTFHGTNRARDGAYARMLLGAAEVLVEYEYEAGEDAVMDLNSPMCGPGCAANASILGVLINGTWCDPEDFMDPDTIERWREAICDSEEVAARASVEDYHASRHMEEA